MIYYHFNIPTVDPFRCADTHIEITFAIFSSSGKVPSLIDILTKCVSGVIYSLIHCFIINAGISSCPAAELFNVDITAITYVAVIRYNMTICNQFIIVLLITNLLQDVGLMLSSFPMTLFSTFQRPCISFPCSSCSFL